MKAILIVACFIGSTAIGHAEVVKYRQANGQTLISNQGAGNGAREISVHREEYISPDQRQNAIDDLQRQKEFLNTRERNNRASVANSSYADNTAATTNIEQLHACLRKVTGTFGLSPRQEASRKVECYAGSTGLNDDCQRSVAATMRLSTQDEVHYKGQCPR